MGPEVVMLAFIEVHKLASDFKWIELLAADELHQEPETIRLVVDGDKAAMAEHFVSRYQAKRNGVAIPQSQRHQLVDLCEEVGMARVMIQKQQVSPDVMDLLPTSVIHFKYPERTSFRKSRKARVEMFHEEARQALEERDFARCRQRLDWVLLLDNQNEEAFQRKIVCLRNWGKIPECVPVFEAWIAIQPENLAPRIGLSEAWLFLGQNLRAMESFEAILERDGSNHAALIGRAQVRCKLGHTFLPDLRKAWMLDPEETVEYVENHFDFRGPKPDDLQARTFKDISKAYQLPIKRLLQRAERGVVPMHPPEGDGLLRFSSNELDRYYEVLRSLGLELGGRNAKGLPNRGEPQAVQQNLFEEENEEGTT